MISLIVAFVLLCVAVMVLGVASGKPYGWFALGIAVMALLVAVIGKLTGN
jgi:hypothetical protein